MKLFRNPTKRESHATRQGQSTQEPLRKKVTTTASDDIMPYDLHTDPVRMKEWEFLHGIRHNPVSEVRAIIGQLMIKTHSDTSSLVEKIKLQRRWAKFVTAMEQKLEESRQEVKSRQRLTELVEEMHNFTKEVAEGKII